MGAMRSFGRDRTIPLVMALACAVGLAACGRPGGSIEKTGERFLTFLVAEDYTAAASLLDPGCAQKLPPERIKQSWDGFRRTVGRFRRERALRTLTEPDGRVVAITCEFERRTMDLWLRFDPQGRIVDVRFVAPGKKPSTREPKAAPPAGQPQKKGAGGQVAT